MSVVARSRSTDRRYYGVVEAVVTDVNDPDKEGRVKLQFPWFDASMTTEWCRVSQFYAGNGYGAFWVPEVGDEVVVAFVHGDMRLPIVLGGLHNGQDKPATFRANNKDQKLIRTKAGHQILLDDTANGEKIRIVAKGDKNFIEINTTGDSITIESTSGKLTLKAKEIELKATTTIKAEATGQMTLKGATINLN